MGCFSVEAPDPVNPAQVGKESLQTQMDLAPSVFNLEQIYQPKYAQLQNETLRNTLFGQQQFTVSDAAKELAKMDSSTAAQIEAEAKAWGLSPAQWLQGHVTEQAGLGNQQALDAIKNNGSKSPGLIDTYQQLTPALSKLQADANTAQRTADIADVEALAGRAQQAYKNANPDLAAAMDALKSSVSSYKAPTLTAPTLGAGTQANAAGITGPAMGQIQGASAANLDPTQMGRIRSATGSPLMPALNGAALQGLNGKTSIQQELEAQAMQDLQSSGNLSAAGQRQAQQSARAAAADRGMVFSNSAIFQEALNSEDLRQKRLAEARTFAGQVDAAGQQSLNSARNFASAVAGQGNDLSMFNAGQQNQATLQRYGTEADLAKYAAELQQQANLFNASQANQATLQQYGTNADLAKYAAELQQQANIFNAGQANQMDLARYGTEADLAKYSAELARVSNNDQFSREASLASMLQSQAQDPFAMVLGRSATPNQTMGAVGQADATQSGPKYFDPFNSSIMSIYAGNTANQLAANTATANNNSALFGSVIGAGGMLGAAALLCWVAREVYGHSNPKWLEFRQYILQRAPRDLYEKYAEAGPQLAKAVSKSSNLRNQLRVAMDRILERESSNLAAA